MTDPVDREFRLALWKLHILHHAAQGPVYGLWLLNELARHGHRVSPGTLYPILERMERNGWLRSASAKRRNGRRNYRITGPGRSILDELRADVSALHRELVLDVGATTEAPAAQSTARVDAADRPPRRTTLGSEERGGEALRRGAEGRRG